MNLKFIVYGRVPAKSSSRQLIFRKAGRPLIISSKECRQYEKDFLIQTAQVEKGVFGDNRIAVSIHWYTDSFRQDIDSPAKILFDCMQKTGIIKNDNRIDEYHIQRHIDKVNPRAEIWITDYVA